MKKLIAYFTIFLGISIISFAQNSNQGMREQKTPDERAEMQTQRLTKELSLTADQTPKVKAALLKKNQDAETIRTKYASAADKSGMKQEMKTLDDQTEANLKQIFTADQNTKYQSMKSQGQGGEHKGNGGQGEHHGGGDHHGGKHKQE